MEAANSFFGAEPLPEQSSPRMRAARLSRLRKRTGANTSKTGRSRAKRRREVSRIPGDRGNEDFEQPTAPAEGMPPD